VKSGKGRAPGARGYDPQTAIPLGGLMGQKKGWDDKQKGGGEPGGSHDKNEEKLPLKTGKTEKKKKGFLLSHGLPYGTTVGKVTSILKPESA